MIINYFINHSSVAGAVSSNHHMHHDVMFTCTIYVVTILLHRHLAIERLASVTSEDLKSTTVIVCMQLKIRSTSCHQTS